MGQPRLPMDASDFNATGSVSPIFDSLEAGKVETCEFPCKFEGLFRIGPKV